MAAQLTPWPKARFFTRQGSLPLAGGKVYTYEAGTTTPKPTFTDASGNTPNTNPIILDAYGEADIWIDGTLKYVLYDSNDVLQWTVDDIGITNNTVYNATTIGGSGNNIIVSETTPSGFTLTYGYTLTIVATDFNTGPVTIDINNLGPVTIKKRAPTGLVDLQAGDFAPGYVVYLFYDGTYFQAVNIIYVPIAQLYDSNIIAGFGDFLINHIATDDITITLPPTNLFPNYFAFPILALGGNVTLVPDAGNSIQGQADGTPFIITEGSSASLTTDGSDWYLNYFAAPFVPPPPPPPPVAYIAGYLPSNISGTSTTATLDVSGGQATDTTNAVSVTKSTTTAWAVSNGNAINGYQGGTTLPNSSTIHFFICTGTSGTGVFAHNGLTPTLPTGYNTSYRRIFSLNTNSSGALIGGTAIEMSGGGLLYWLATEVLDISTTTLSTTRTAYTLTVPTGMKVKPIYRANTATNNSVIFTSGDQTDVAPSTYGTTGFNTAPGFDITGGGVGGTSNVVMQTREGTLTTNTLGQIGARSGAATTSLYWVTSGFEDARRA